MDVLNVLPRDQQSELIFQGSAIPTENSIADVVG